jgi:hypothetical protein
MPGSQTVSRSSGEGRNVRVSGATHAKIGDLAAQLGRPMQDVVDIAVETLRRKQILEATRKGYALLRQDPEASHAFDSEMAAWDQTMNDGLV